MSEDDDELSRDEDVLNLMIEFDKGTESVLKDDYQRKLSLANTMTVAELREQIPKYMWSYKN